MRRAIVISSSVVTLLTVMLVWTRPLQTEPPPDVGSVERLLRYRFAVTNPTDRLVENAWVGTYAPLDLPGTQSVQAIKASHPYRVHWDALGNQQIHFDLHRLPPYQSEVISLQVTIALAESLDQPSLSPSEGVLRPEPYIESTDREIVLLAKQLRDDDPAVTARQIYGWIVKNVVSAGYRGSSRGAAYALAQRRGDCTELTYLFTALSRASGLPARAVAGYVLAEDGLLEPHGYHNWAQVYVNGSWWNVDPLQGVFMAPATQYIVMQRLGAGIEDAPSPRNAFLKASENVHVRMEG